MTLQEIRIMARGLGIKNVSKYKKDALIRQVQQAEGNSPCFRGIENCGELDCAWREECQS
ncbi:MAG: Rho termination factor N-terminal domain-containing protein [Pseudomonadota bacterium]